MTDGDRRFWRNEQKAGWIKYPLQVVLLLAILMGLTLATGCGKKSTTPTQTKVDRLVEEGWVLFSEEDYTGALDKFEEALDELREHPGALLGKGWTLAFLADFHEAKLAFTNSKEMDSSDPDTWAGGAFVYSALNDQDQVVFWAETAFGVQVVKDGTTNWIFSRRSSITHQHLRWVLAKAYWVRGSLVQCRDQLDIIEPGTTHGETTQELLDDLQRLNAIYGSPF